jgi:cytochrome b involved in lipid metabolism
MMSQCEVISVHDYEREHGSLNALSHTARKSLRDAECEIKKKFDECLQEYRSKKGQKIITRSEALTHNRANDAYVIINNMVYDVTTFLEFHPGGYQTLLKMAGKDATNPFEGVLHNCPFTHR